MRLLVNFDLLFLYGKLFKILLYRNLFEFISLFLILESRKLWDFGIFPPFFYFSFCLSSLSQFEYQLLKIMDAGLMFCSCLTLLWIIILLLSCYFILLYLLFYTLICADLCFLNSCVLFDPFGFLVFDMINLLFGAKAYFQAVREIENLKISWHSFSNILIDLTEWQTYSLAPGEEIIILFSLFVWQD